MFEDTSDSFDSSSDSDAESHPVERAQDAPQAAEPSNGSSTVKPRAPAMTQAKLFDNEELEGSTSSSVFSAKSVKPKKSFLKRTWNIGSFKRKIKNKKKKGDSTVFGVPLETAIERSRLGSDGIELPTVFRQCIDFIEDNALEQEGIYRLAGVKSKIEAARVLFDKGESVDFTDYDPNVVASLLKLYFRMLPEPLVPTKLTSRFEAATARELSSEDQCALLQLLLSELPPSSRLVIGWLVVHMKHIADHSQQNKMNVLNLIIVFSPTLQISVNVLQALYAHREALFGHIKFSKYSEAQSQEQQPQPVVRKSSVINFLSSNPLETEEEITIEEERLAGILAKVLAGSAAVTFDGDRDEYCWGLQRTITNLRRRRKAIQKKPQQEEGDDTAKSSQQPVTGGEGFIKTLLLMEAMLIAENEALLARKEQLQNDIRREAELIDQYKIALKEREQERVELAKDSESGDELELVRKVEALKWQNKELELRKETLIRGIQDEEASIVQLKVKVKEAGFSLPFG
ncbi:hypothetical protein EMCRGX_G027768 [Ephydatia muelleri]